MAERSVVLSWLRHQSPATTAIYTQVDDTERRAAVLGLPFGLDDVSIGGGREPQTRKPPSPAHGRRWGLSHQTSRRRTV